MSTTNAKSASATSTDMIPISDLWYDRWQEALYIQPEFIQIITWNNYGESHYIGPLYDESMEAFDVGKAPFNYVTDMPHDSWRLILPFIIDLYKTGTAEVYKEVLSTWYRLAPRAACPDGGTTGNTATQLQLEFRPGEVVQDKIFYTALLASEKPVKVIIGGVDLGAAWTDKPSGGVGLYHGSVAYGGHTGAVVVSVNGMVVNGKEITTNCNRTPGQNGVANWNAWPSSPATRRAPLSCHHTN